MVFLDHSAVCGRLQEAESCYHSKKQPARPKVSSVEDEIICSVANGYSAVVVLGQDRPELVICRDCD